MNELTKQTEGNAVSTVPKGAWGAEGTFKSDLLISRLMLVQDKAKVLKSGRVEKGSIIDSTTLETLVTKGQPLAIIPVATFNDWIINEIVEKNGKTTREYRGKVKMTPENEHWARHVVDQEGAKLERVRCINFFVLLPTRIDDFPMLVSFKNTNTPAGKQLSTYFQRCQMKGVPPAGQVFNLSVADQSREGYDFFVYNVEQARVTKPNELEIAFLWYQTLAKSNVKLADEEAAQQPGEEPIPF